MGIGATRDQRNNSCNAEFSAFFNRPFHTIELEDGEDEREVRESRDRHFLAKCELDSALLDFCDASAAHDGTGSNIEFLSNSGAENASQMVGVFAGKSGAVVREFVGDPSASGHSSRVIGTSVLAEHI